MDIYIRVQANDSFSEEFTGDIEQVALSVESIVGTALLEVFDVILVESIKVTSSPSIDVSQSSTTIRIWINEEPLTARNLATIIGAITELYTKCWLVAEGRFPDLIEYTETRNPLFEKEANLVITKLAYNSPGLIEFNPDPEKIAKALETGIDAITQTSTRLKAAKQDIQARELDMRLKEQEMQSVLADKEQARQIEAQKAESDKQLREIDIETKKLILEKERLELRGQSIKLDKMQRDDALETATKMIDMLSPNADGGTRAMLARTLLSSLLQVGNGRDMVIELISPQKTDEDTIETDE